MLGIYLYFMWIGIIAYEKGVERLSWFDFLVVFLLGGFVGILLLLEVGFFYLYVDDFNLFIVF